MKRRDRNKVNFHIILIVSGLLFPIIGLYNDIIFNELNIFILTPIIICYTLYNVNKINLRIFRISSLYIFICIILYSLFMDDNLVDDNSYNYEIYALCCYFILFLCSSIMFYGKEYLSNIVWFFSICYLFCYIARITFKS